MTTLLLTAVVFAASGWAAAVILRLSVPASPAGRMATFYLAGLVANGSILYVLGALRVPLSPAVMAAVPAVLLVAAALLRRRGRRFIPQPAGRPPLIASVLLAIPLLALLFSAAVLPVRDVDGRVFWLPKARAISVEQAIDGPFFQGSAGLNMHSRYPLLLPLDAASVMSLSGERENEAARWLYVLLAVSALVAAREVLGRAAPCAAPWVIAAAAWLPALAAVEGGALSAYSDLAVAAFAGTAVLLLAVERPDEADVRSAAVFAAGAVMAKNEGAVLALVIAVALLVTRRLALRTLMAFAGVAGAAFVLLSLWRMRIPLAWDERYALLATGGASVAGRISRVLNVLVAYLFDWKVWGAFWPMTTLALLVAAFRRETRRAVAFPALVLVGGLSAWAAALMVTSWDPDQLALVAMDRLLMQLLLPACAILAVAGETLVRWARASGSSPAPDRAAQSGKIRAR